MLVEYQGYAMKNYLFFAFLLFFSVSVWAAPQQKSDEYNVNVHVTGSRMVLHGDSSLHYQYLNVTIDGKKYELSSIRAFEQLLMLGDYKARLVTDDHAKGNYEGWRVFEFQFPDKKTRRFTVVGQLE
jgi:hypothetical protein